MSHVTHRVSRYGSWMSHVTHMKESWHTYEWVMSHIWMSHVTHMNESCHTYEWAMSHIWMSHVTHMNESCHTYEWVMSHIWRSHVTHMKESCHTYEWAMSHIWMSHVTHMNKSCHTYEWAMSHIWMSHVTHINESYCTDPWHLNEPGFECRVKQHIVPIHFEAVFVVDLFFFFQSQVPSAKVQLQKTGLFLQRLSSRFTWQSRECSRRTRARSLSHMLTSTNSYKLPPNILRRAHQRAHACARACDLPLFAFLTHRLFF